MQNICKHKNTVHKPFAKKIQENTMTCGPLKMLDVTQIFRPHMPDRK